MDRERGEKGGIGRRKATPPSQQAPPPDSSSQHPRRDNNEVRFQVTFVAPPERIVHDPFEVALIFQVRNVLRDLLPRGKQILSICCATRGLRRCISPRVR
jgi:hypothetical protein